MSWSDDKKLSSGAKRTTFSQLFCLVNQPKNLSPLCGISPVCGSSIMGIVLLEENILRFWAYFQIGGEGGLFMYI